MSSEKTHLQDYAVNRKLILAGLWTAATLCYLYGDYFELYAPGKVEGLLNGENVLNSPLRLLIASIILAIPPLMIVGSLLLKPTVNKWLNLVVGSLFTAMQLLVAIGSLIPWYSFYVFLAVLEAILTALVVWCAIKWPRIHA